MNREALEFGSIVRKHQMDPEILRWMGLVKHAHAETYRHCVRVTAIGGLLGKALALSPHDQEHLAMGCLLHDVGKMKIPKKLLDTPAPLNDKEWKLMKLHPCIGEELLASGRMPSPDVTGTVRNHHERWDGKGYPDRLQGEEIPLFARICSVADAFDSMVTERPYQSIKTYDKALLELQQQAGTQFDVAVVVRFGGVFHQVKQMYSSGTGLFQIG